MSLSYLGVLEQQPSDKGNDVRFSNTFKQVSPNIFVLGHISFYKVRTFYVMWLFRDLLHSTKSTRSSKTIFFIIDKTSSQAGFGHFRGPAYCCKYVVSHEMQPLWHVRLATIEEETTAVTQGNCYITEPVCGSHCLSEQFRALLF